MFDIPFGESDFSKHDITIIFLSDLLSQEFLFREGQGFPLLLRHFHQLDQMMSSLVKMMKEVQRENVSQPEKSRNE
jgi:hypothetical protein